ncbi:MAG: exodeoxyribonuclease VII large subunit [Armatimonadota bacterium]
MSECSTQAQVALSVSELTAYLKRLIDRDELLSQVSVRGEISNFTRHRSGHLYFSLKDEASQLSCVCFRGDAARLDFDPADGQRVVAHGNVTVYEPRGNYQLIVRAMRPDGAGELAEAIAKLRARLAAEGLFEPARKRPLPRFPRRIALVTSPTGAAVRDLVSVISRRFPPAELVVVPTVVQGEAAPESIVRSLRLAAEACRADLVILGRGGGSLEDLWAFFDERVVRAVFACPVPVISAVGHETDLCLCDEAADLRAPTPSAAGELAVPDVRELRAQIQVWARRAAGALAQRMQAQAARLGALAQRPALRRPLSMLEPRWQRLDEAALRAGRVVERVTERLRHRLTRSALTVRTLDPRVRRRLTVLDRQRARIEGAEQRARVAAMRRLDALGGRLRAAEASLRALDPRGVVGRGYTLVWRDRDRRLVRSVAEVVADDGIHASVSDGEIAARVTGTRWEQSDGRE